MSEAFVTLATNDEYALGAINLAMSLKRVGTTRDIAIMITDTVGESMRNVLSQVFNHVERVSVFDSNDTVNLGLLQRPDLGITFTKIHCWRLTQYSKAVFMDADIIVLQNIDDLFDREELSAAPDPGWPDCFNSGVFVFQPNLDRYSELLQFALEHGSFDGGDQGLLNMFFSTWPTDDIKKHLPFTYNCTSQSFYSYAPALMHYYRDIKVVHFIGPIKPWNQSYDASSGQVTSPDGNALGNEFLTHWWSIFVTDTKPLLPDNMGSLVHFHAKDCAVSNDGKKEVWNCLSVDKDDLLSNLKLVIPILHEFVAQKNVIMQSQHIDFTQSIWTTYFFPNYVTPWDNLIIELKKKLRDKSAWFSTIIYNASRSQDKTVTELMVTTVGLYLQITGDSDTGFQLSKEIIEISKAYLKCVHRGKRQLGLELISLIAKYSPFSLWYHSRRRASIFALQTVNELFEETKRSYEQLDVGKYLKLCRIVLYSVLDGRKAHSLIIGEDWTQIDDLKNPPFDDLHYKLFDDAIVTDVSRVTDIFDEWDEYDLNKQASFDIEQCLTEICENVLQTGLTLLPLDCGNQDCLEKMCRVLEILSRCSLRVQSSSIWSEFIERLLPSAPYKYVDVTAISDDEQMEVDNGVNDKCTEKLTKSEKKLRQARLQLAARMKESCRKETLVKDVKAVEKLIDDINYYTVALVHQSIVSAKTTVTDTVNEWQQSRLVAYMATRDTANNTDIRRWISLAKQLFQLSFDRMSLCNTFSSFCHDLFMSAHAKSKIRRTSLAAFIECCMGYRSLLTVDTPGSMPVVSAHFLASVVDQMIEEHKVSGDLGPVSSHPTFASTQTHIDITLPLALHKLLSVDYPGVALVINTMDTSRTTVLKNILTSLRRDITDSQYPPASRAWNMFMQEKLSHVPSKYYWDYFTVDDVVRRDGPKTFMRPLCSSVATFMMK